MRNAISSGRDAVSWPISATRRKQCSFDFLGFYRKALLLQWNVQQQPAISDLRKRRTTHQSVGQLSLKHEEVEKILYSICLIFSRRRDGPSGASSEITAGLLREKPIGKTIDKSREYTLYIAKNKGFNKDDTRFMKRVELWLNTTDTFLPVIYDNDDDLSKCPDDQMELLILDHLENRINSYLGAAPETNRSKDDNNKKRISAHEKLLASAESCLENQNHDPRQKQMLRALVELHKQIVNRRAKEMLREAAEFVKKYKAGMTGSRHSSQSYEVFSSLWDQVERMARIPTAIDCLTAFRRVLLASSSRIKIMKVMPQENIRQISLQALKRETQMFALRRSKKIQEDLGLTESEIDAMLTSLLGEWNYGPRVVHCEIQLFNHILTDEKANLGQFHKFIACSKEPCWLCALFIPLCSNFEVAQSHGGVYFNWALPKPLADRVAGLMALYDIDDRMNIIIEEAMGKKQWDFQTKRRESIRVADIFVKIEEQEKLPIAARTRTTE